MEGLRAAVCEIAEQYKLECGEKEIDQCTHLVAALAATEQDMVKALCEKQIEVDSVIEKEYVLLLYTIMMKYAYQPSVDFDILLSSCLKAAYARYLEDNDTVQTYYTKKKKEIEALDEEHGSIGAIAYALIDSDEKLFDKETMLSVLEQQAAAILGNMIKTMDGYGLKDWHKKESEESEETGELSQPSKPARRKRTELEVFHDSAELCVFRSEVARRLEDVTCKLNRRFNEDETYRKTYKNNRVPKGERAKPIIIAWFAAILISEVFQITLLALLVTPAAIAAYVLISKWDDNTAMGHAAAAAQREKEQRIEYEKHRAEWEEAKKTYTEVLESVTEALREMIKLGGGVPEYLWDHAMEVWGFVEYKRADTLKEAINQYEYKKRCDKEDIYRNRLNQEIQRLHEQVDNLQTSQAEMASEMDRLAYNDELRKLGDWLDYKIPPYFYM